MTLGPQITLCYGAVGWLCNTYYHRNISEIKEGAYVAAYNHETGKWEPKQVAQTFVNDYDGKLVEIQVTNGDNQTDTITATIKHPFWVVSGEGLEARPLAIKHAGSHAVTQRQGGRWVNSNDLKIGDQLLLGNSKSATVTGLLVRNEKTKVYNFEVEELHNYAVGWDGVLAHNNCGLNEARSVVDPAIRGNLGDIRRLDADAIVGYRGSLSRGKKGAHKGGGAV